MAFWSKLSLFWRFQLAGWGAFVVVTFPLKCVLSDNLTAAFVLCVVRDGSSFLLTLALRRIYRHCWSGDSGRMAALIIVSCAMAGLLQGGLFLLLHPVVSTDGEFSITHAMGLDVFYERTGLLYAWSFLYFGIRQAIDGTQRRLDLALLEVQLLRAQMNPHFLYNALNTLQADAGKSPDHLKQLTQALAEYLRYSLETRNKDFVPLGRELDAIRDYLMVEKARFRDELQIESQIDESTRDLLVPGVVIQPLIENAIKYGRVTSSKPVTVRLVTSQPDSCFLRIEVSNTGHWVEQEHRHPDNGVGLENLRRRLALLYPEPPEFRILKEDGWVTVQVDLPIES